MADSYNTRITNENLIADILNRGMETAQLAMAQSAAGGLAQPTAAEPGGTTARVAGGKLCPILYAEW